MARVCYSCGKGPVTGHKVSHANNKSKRRWLPNLQTVKIVERRAPPGPGVHSVHLGRKDRQGPTGLADRGLIPGVGRRGAGCFP